MSGDIVNICLVDAPPVLARAFRDGGARVLAVTASPEPFFDLPAALAEHGFAPDLVLQVERLAQRSVLTGLDSLDCPLLFWAVDPHLNAHWQGAYARLFDVVCSTQKAWTPRLAERGAPDVRWLPWFAPDRPFLPWAERKHGLAFVGRVTDQRPARRWLVEFLRERSAVADPAIRDSVPFPEMLDLYSRSGIIPNESIFGEVNFRLFEGAGCGCLVVGQDIEEQAELFEPGREMDTYAHVVELADKLAGYAANDRLVQTMARAAHTRVRADHLPEHRARRILEYARSAAKNRAGGAAADKWTGLAAAAMWEAGVLAIGPGKALGLLAACGQDADVVSAALRVQAASGRTDVLENNLEALLTRSTEGMRGLNRTASLAALRLNNFKWAKAFWYRHQEDRGVVPVPPESPNALYGLWAGELRRADRGMRPGFAFDPDRHLPDSAAECLAVILADRPEDLDALRRMDAVLRTVPGTAQTRVGYLSVLTLHERGDWRPALEIGLADLASYRLDSGLDELRLARELAVAAGQETAFDRVLKGRDPSGRIARRLDVSPA